jgi:hypothetical protein
VYDEVVAGASPAIVCSPELALPARNEDEIRAGIEHARRLDVPVHVTSTGHGAHHDITNGMLISTRGLRGAQVDPTSSTATIGAGVTWGEVVAASPLGLAPVAGSSPDVGVVGYLLGGGLGPLVRSHGYSSDYLEAARVLTWTGDLIEASATKNADVLWALRGGHPSIGVVTQVRVRLVPLTRLFGGYLVFGPDVMDHVFRAWGAWTASLDPRMTTTAAFVHPPGDAPRSLAIHCAFHGPSAEGAALIEALRDFGPDVDTVQELPAAEIARVFDDPRGLAATWSRGLMLSSFDDSCIEAMVSLFGADGTMPFVKVQLRHLAGAASTDIETGSPAPGRSCPFILGALGINAASFAHEYPAAFTLAEDRLMPWASRELTPSFAGRGQAAWSLPDTQRLRGIEAAWASPGR